VSAWSEGYLTEIGYTHGYYHELKPLLMRQALLNQAVQHRWSGPGQNAALRYLELGIGQGLSLNIHAAASPGEYWGCDFNPAQVANAQALAEASGANVRILEASFEELAARTDLPAFDVIALHGVWSWISDANRRLIVEIARRHLDVGGVLYVSYNTNPGWAPNMPLRHLLTLHADLASAETLGISPRIDGALAFAQSLADANSAYFRGNPLALDRLKTIKGQPRTYVAHEYFNTEWHPMAFSDMARQLAEAKLSYATTAHLLDHLAVINLTADQQKILQGLQHTVLRESVRDFLMNQQFRRDLWVKGPRPLPPSAHAALARAQHYALVTLPDLIPMKAKGLVGEVDLQEAIYRPVIAALAADACMPKTFAQLWGSLPSLNERILTEALVLLCGLGHVVPAQAPDIVQAAQPACDRLNASLFEQSVASHDVSYLASPVAGGGVAVSRFQQLFLRSLKAGRTTPQEWATDACRILAEQGQQLQKDGRALVTPEETLAEMTAQASTFQAQRLPILRALRVA
jgi:SAM-dependent methyltransferase